MSGLAAARLLLGLAPASRGPEAPPAGRPEGLEVVVLEASGRFGGRVGTLELDGVRLEAGPDQFVRRNGAAEHLARLVGLGSELIEPSAGTAAIYSYGALRRFPAGLVLGIPTDRDSLKESGIVSAKGVVAYEKATAARLAPIGAAEVGRGEAGAERSAGDLLRPRLGDEVVERLVDPLLGGINAGSIDGLSLGVTAPQVAEALIGTNNVVTSLSRLSPTGDGGRTSPFLGIKGGLERLVTACVAELEAAGAELIPGFTTQSVSERAGRYLLEDSDSSLECDGVVLALPPGETSRLLGPLVPEVAVEIGRIETASVVLATFSFERSRLELPAGLTGFLVPRGEERLMTAATFLTAKWPWMSSETRSFVRVSAGRDRDDRPSELSDDALAHVLQGELRELAGIEEDPASHAVVRYAGAFPQYRPGHLAHMGEVKAAISRHNSLALAGSFLGGVGIPACIESGEKAAFELLAGLGR